MARAVAKDLVAVANVTVTTPRYRAGLCWGVVNVFHPLIVIHWFISSIATDCYWIAENVFFKRSSLIVKRFPQKRYPPSYLSGRWFTDFESKHRSSCHIALLPFLVIKMIVIACSVKITPHLVITNSFERAQKPPLSRHSFFIGSQRINLWWLMRVWHPELPKRPWKWRDMWRRRYVYYV